MASFCKINNIYDYECIDFKGVENQIDLYLDQINSLKSKRKEELVSKTNFSKNSELSDSLSDEIFSKTNEKSIILDKIKSIEVEAARVHSLKENLNFELDHLSKIILGNDNMNLFSSNVCPLCKNELNKHEDSCSSYENNFFVYDYSDYIKIRSEKLKKLDLIEDALKGIFCDLEKSRLELNKINSETEDNKRRLSNILSFSVYHGNLAILEDLNDKICDVSDALYALKKEKEIYDEIKRLDKNKNLLKAELEIKKRNLERKEASFVNENKEVVIEFSKIFRNCMLNSSLHFKTVEIDDSYMPVIDGGTYRAKSTAVTIRLMYYFSLLIYSLKNNVKFPRFMIIDTPEDSGIDRENLIQDISSFEKVLSEMQLGSLKDFQLILTSGEGRYPADFKKYIVDEFDTTEQKYILSRR